MRWLLPSGALALATSCGVDIPDVHGGGCDPDAAFVQLSPVAGLGGFGEQSARLSPDELTIVFSRELDAPAQRHGDLYVAQRADRDAAFGDVLALDALSSAADELTASFSQDLLTLYLDRQIEDRRYEILATARATTRDAFAEPVGVSLGAARTSDYEPFAVDGAIYFASTRNGFSNLFSARGAGTVFDPPIQVLPRASGVYYEHPIVTADERTIYFSAPLDGAPTRDIWSATRPTRDQPFGTPRLVTAINTAGQEYPTWISPDSCRLYFMTDRTRSTFKPNFELWMAARRAE